MKTPFDPALRVQRRVIDHLRITLKGERDLLTEVEAEALALTERYQRESAAVAADWTCSSFAYGQRLRDRRVALVADRRRIDAGIDQLRARALAAAGEMSAITDAAGEFRLADRRRGQAVEQAEVDDRSATRGATRSRQTRSHG